MLNQKFHWNTSQQDEQTISQSYILQNGKKIITNYPGKQLYNIRIKNKSYSLQIISLPQQHDFYEEYKVERILREIRAQYKTNYEKAAQIKSKNIVSPIQYFGYYDKVCIVEEQFECTLTSYMKENSLGYIDTLQVMKQLFQGVHDLHRAKISHRTLNPQNIVVQVGKNKPVFKLCGLMDSFDFSKRMPKNAPESHSLLSQEMKKFRAPQIRLGSPHDEKIDVWSLGAIFVWILYGNFNRIKLFQNQQEKKQYYVDCSDKFPKWFTNFLNKLLSYDPKERYSISDGLSIIKSALLCSDQTIQILRNSGLEI